VLFATFHGADDKGNLSGLKLAHRWSSEITFSKRAWVTTSAAAKFSRGPDSARAQAGGTAE
jgi:hypothetical protein